MRARNPGDLLANKTFDFMFENVEKQHETYNGINARLRSVPLCLGRICAIDAPLLCGATPRSHAPGTLRGAMLDGRRTSGGDCAALA